MSLLEKIRVTQTFLESKGIEKLYRYYEEHIEELDLETIRSDELLKLCKTK